MSNENSTAAPAMPADFFTNPQARVAYEAGLAQHLAGKSQAGVPASTGHAVRSESGVMTTPAGAPQPHAEDLATLDETMRHDGGKAYFSNPQFREVSEKHRTALYKGQQLDRDAATRELLATLGIVPATPAAPAAASEPAEPLGTPTERAGAKLEAPGGYLDSDDFESMPAEVRDDVCAGYRIDLAGPDGGYVFTGEDAAQLKAARAAGVMQQQVDAFVRELRRQG